MYERYELVFTKDGVEIRKNFNDPILGKDTRSKKIPYRELEVLKEIIDRWRPTIEGISVDELREGEMLKGIKTLKMEIGVRINQKDDTTIGVQNSTKVSEINEIDNQTALCKYCNKEVYPWLQGESRVSTEKIERAIIKVIGDGGGTLRRPLVHERVYQIIEEFRDPYYHEMEPNGQYERWKHRVDTVKAKLVKEGYLKSPSEVGRSNWVLTEKGKDYYEAIKDSAI